MNVSAVLVCTLGTEPQVLTLSLSHLLDRGVPIREAVALYSQSSDSRIQRAIETIKSTWSSLPFGDVIPIRLDEIPIRDLDSSDALAVAYRTIRKWISKYKSLGWNVHFNISGGRKPLALCAFIAAQFLFSYGDHLWYLVSSPDLVSSRRLLGEPGESKLIELPVPQWSEIAPFLAALTKYDDPWAVATVQRKLLREEERQRWRSFLNSELTPAERQAVRELVLRGGTNAEIAMRLHKSPRTIGHQLSAVFRKVRVLLGLSPKDQLDRTTLVALLSPYFRENDLYGIGRTADDEREIL